MNKCLSTNNISENNHKIGKISRNFMSIETSSSFHRFINKDEEYVTRLNYFNPKLNNTKTTLYNLNTQPVADLNDNKILPTITLPNNTEHNIQNHLSISTTSQRKFYQRRAENIITEDKLNNEKDKIFLQIEQDKRDINELYGSLIEVNKKIDEINIDLDVLNNYRSFTLLDNKISNSIVNYPKNGFEAKLLMQRKIEEKMSAVKEKKKDKEMQLKKYLEEKEKIITLIEKMEKKNKITKEKYNEIRQELLIHYHTLLAEGKDTRKEGLSWIIKEIWKLKSNVILNHLPNFLDEKAIFFLFENSKNSIVLEELKKKLKKLQKKIKFLQGPQKSIKNVENKKNNCKEETFQTSLYKSNNNKGNAFLSITTDNDNNSKPRLEIRRTKNKKSSIIMRNPEKITLLEVEKVLKKNDQIIDRESLDLLGKIKLLDKTIQDFKEGMKAKKKEELDRINIEFFKNNYQRRFGVSQEMVISAIIGEDFMAHELFREKKKQKEYLAKIKALRIGNPWDNSRYRFPKVDNDKMLDANYELDNQDEK